MQRRDFLLGSIAGVGVLGAAGAVALGGRDPQESTNTGPGPGSTGGPIIQPGGNLRSYSGRNYQQGPAGLDAPNVIFIVLDDQNDWMGFCNDRPGTSTPNADALAGEGVNFTNAYAPAPMCLPSRTALLYGRRPNETEVYDHDRESQNKYNAFARATPSLVDDFWVAGYDTRGAGKIFNFEDARRWSEYALVRPWVPGPDRDSGDVAPSRYRTNWISPYDGQPEGLGERFLPADIDFGPSDVPLDVEPDMIATTYIRQQLAAQHGRPFFLGLGLGAMHDPWRVPQRFLDEHPLDDVETPEYRPDDLDDLPAYARESIVDTFHAFQRLYDSGKWSAAVQAYQAATSFADYCIGLLLDDLASSPYADNTIVVVFGDNGFHLGEKMHLHKFTLWNPATHVPLTIKAPGQLDAGELAAPVSLLDVGPTLHELTGVEGLFEDHQGVSMVPVVEDPATAADRPAVMTWREGNHAVRREEWRYIRYTDDSTELYDREADPDELKNLSGEAAYADVEAELDSFLPGGSRYA